MNFKCRRLFVNFRLAYFIVLFLLPLSAFAVDYYIDSVQGVDSYDGLTPSTAWQTLTKISQTTFSLGDRIYTRGEFRGTVRLTLGTNGTADNPIVLDGESWSGAKSKIFGTRTWSPVWIQCASPDQVAGNPQYQNIWYTDAPPTWSNIPENNHFFKPIYENGEFLWFSTQPNLPDPFHYEDHAHFNSVPPTGVTVNSLSDPNEFIQPDPTYYTGTYIGIRDYTNQYVYDLINSYDPSTSTVTLSKTWTPYTDRNTDYNLMNHVAFIDTPGEYAYQFNENRIYIWPRTGGDPNANTYEVAHEVTGIDVNGRDYITVKGFDFSGLYSLPGQYEMGVAVHVSDNDYSNGVTVEDNRITKIRAMRYSGAINLYQTTGTLVQNNQLESCQNSIGVLGQASRDVIVRNNTITRTTKLGVWFQGLQNGQIIHNEIRDILGVHANGITAYLQCSDLLIAGNKVWGSNNPITLKDGTNVYIIGNLLDGAGSFSIAEWSGNMSGDVFILNNVAVNANAGAEFTDSNTSLYLQNGQGANYVVANNVLDGMSVANNYSLVNRFHNYYTALHWSQKSAYGWTLLEGEQSQYTNLSQLFNRYAEEDYSPANGSPLIAAGADVSAYYPINQFPGYDYTLDLAGNSVGAEYNVGVYEGPVIGPPPGTPTPTPSAAVLTVNSIRYESNGGKQNDLHLNVIVQVVDSLAQPMPASIVQYRIAHESGQQWDYSGTTDSLGEVVCSLKNVPNGTYTTTVLSVQKESFIWDGITPPNAFTKSPAGSTATPTPTVPPTQTPTFTPEPTATSTPEPTATNTPEPTSTPTPEPTFTNTPHPTSTDTPEPTSTSTPESTATHTPLPEPSATPTITDTPLATPTMTEEPTLIPTSSPTATATPTTEPSPTLALTPTATDTPEPTATATPESTATNTPEQTATFTPEPTATNTSSPTASNTPEPTATSTHTPEPTSTNTPEPTATNTPEPTATYTVTPTPSYTPTYTSTPTVTPVPSPTVTPNLTSTPSPSAVVLTVDEILYSPYGGKNNNLHMNVVLNVVDGLNQPAQDVNVQYRIQTNSGQQWESSGITDTSGLVSYSLKNIPTGTYTTTILNVQKNGSTWDGITPTNSFTR